MNQAARNYISTALKDGTHLGIVEFSGSAKELAPLTRIESDESRGQLISKLPSKTYAWTSIGAGIEGAIEVTMVHFFSKNGNVQF